MRGVVGLGETATDVADRPAEATEDGEADREERGHADVAAGRAVDGDQAHAADCDDQAHHLCDRHPFTQEQHAENHGEGRRRLQHQRGQSGRHPQAHRQEQEHELHGPEPRHVDEEPLEADLGKTHEQDDRDRHDGEAQRCQKERREVFETEVDRDEVQSPQEHDAEGEQPVTSGHDHHRPRRRDEGQSNLSGRIVQII